MLAEPAVLKTIAEVAPAEPDAKDCVAVERPMVVVMLNNTGMIRECSQNVYGLFGCRPSELVWKHISLLLPELAEVTLVQAGQINSRLRFLSRIGYRFEVTVPGAASCAGKVFFSHMANSVQDLLRVIICPIEDAAARHYDL
jgi:hypothetical protein